MDLSQITPLILTWNEAANISRCLTPLSWAKRIVILDSGGTDETAALVSAFPSVALHTRPFDSHAEQWNHGLTLVQSDWVLALDADYITDQRFAEEIEQITPRPETNAFFAQFVYCICGRQLRATLYPPRAVLFRRAKARYVQDGHTQLLQFDGTAEELNTPIRHDDRKSLAQWLQAQDRYSKLEAQHLLTKLCSQLSFPDRLRRKIFFAPTIMFFYLLFARGLILDGWPGWFYVCQRTIAELLLSIRLLIEARKLEDGSSEKLKTES